MIDPTLQATLAPRGDGDGLDLVAGAFRAGVCREKTRDMGEELVARVNAFLALKHSGRRALKRRLSKIVVRTGGARWLDDDYLALKIALAVREREHAENLAARRAMRAGQ